MLSVYSSRVLFDFGISINAKLSQLISVCNWIWPPARSLEMLEIQNSLNGHILPSTHPDTIIWIPSKSRPFHLGSTWNSIRIPNANVQWFSLIWFKGMVPRHSFICWLVILDRFSTRARQHKYNSDIPPNCVFCGQAETRDYLFFSCPFSSEVWTKVASLLCNISFSSWDLLVRWGETLKKKSLKNTICKHAWRSSVYHVWLEEF